MLLLFNLNSNHQWLLNFPWNLQVRRREGNRRKLDRLLGQGYSICNFLKIAWQNQNRDHKYSRIDIFHENFLNPLVYELRLRIWLLDSLPTDRLDYIWQNMNSCFSHLTSVPARLITSGSNVHKVKHPLTAFGTFLTAIKLNILAKIIHYIYYFRKDYGLWVVMPWQISPSNAAQNL